MIRGSRILETLKCFARDCSPLGALLLFSTANTSAAVDPPPTPVLVQQNGVYFGDRIDEGDWLIKRSFTVRPNIVGLALNPKRVVLPLPDGGTLEFAVSGYEPRAGLRIAEDGTILIEGERDEISYFLLGRGPGGELFLTVEKGRLIATLAETVAPIEIVGRGTGEHVFREFDYSQVAQVECGGDISAEITEEVARRALAPRWPSGKRFLASASAATPKHY